MAVLEGDPAYTVGHPETAAMMALAHCGRAQRRGGAGTLAVASERAAVPPGCDPQGARKEGPTSPAIWRAKAAASAGGTTGPAASCRSALNARCEVYVSSMLIAALANADMVVGSTQTSSAAA